MLVNIQFGQVTRWILAAILSGLLPSAQSVYREWKSHAKIAVYRSPHDVYPAVYTVPEGTANCTWVFKALGEHGSCAQRQVEVHLQYGSLPPIAFRNESFPDDFFVNRTDYAVMKFLADNSSHFYSLLLPRPGQYYTFTFVTKIEDDNRLLPSGLNLKCEFKSWMFQRVEPGNYTNIPVNKITPFLRVPPDGVIVWFRLPMSTFRYTLEVVHCNESCQLSVMGPLKYGRPNSAKFFECTNSILHGCTIEVKSPDVLVPQYFHLTSQGLKSDVQIRVTTVECVNKWRNSSLEEGIEESSGLCLVMPLLDRWQAPDLFHAHFLHLPDVIDLPDNFTVTLRARFLVSQGFQVHATKDIGTTLTVALDAWQAGLTKDSQHIKLCGMLLRGKLYDHNEHICNMKASHILKANSSAHLSSSSDAISKLHVPFPEAGVWYLTLEVNCYSLDDNGEERPEGCATPLYNASVAVEVNPCLEGLCSAKGACVKVTSGSDLLFYSFCDCDAGWRGYACTDGTEAIPEWEQLAGALLLTLSNLLFIPTILVAGQRGFYAEAGAYTFNMFFSTFYHACDRSGRSPDYFVCIMDFDTLQFADFMASTVSIWVTFMAATRITPSARSFFQVFGILCFSAVYAQERFSIWNNLGTGLVGGMILAASWGFTCHQRRSCYPSKKRYLFFFVPGVVLSVTAIFVFMFAETERNYKVTHSFWHMAISLAVIFFLPRKPLSGRGAFPVERVKSMMRRKFPQYQRCPRWWRKSSVSLELNYAVTEDASNYPAGVEANDSPVLVRRTSLEAFDSSVLQRRNSVQDAADEAAP